MVIAALLGYLGLVTGLLLNEASAVFVILNALRLLKWKSPADTRDTRSYGSDRSRSRQTGTGSDGNAGITRDRWILLFLHGANPDCGTADPGIW